MSHKERANRNTVVLFFFLFSIFLVFLFSTGKKRAKPTEELTHQS
jgi:hypothetical protein